MSRYRKVDPRIWNDAKFLSLSDNGKLMFLLLLSHPSMTSVGAMKGTVPSLGEDLGWKPAKAAGAFAEIVVRNMVEVDPKHRLFWLPNFLRYNPAENPNVLTNWISALDLLPECSLKFLVMRRVYTESEARGEAFTKRFPKGFREAFRKGLANQEQEQEPEQEPKKARPGTVRPEGTTAGQTPSPILKAVGS